MESMLGGHSVDIDNFLLAVRNEHGYVQLELNYQELLTSTQLRDNIRSTVTLPHKSTELVRVIGEWLTLAKTDKNLLNLESADVQTKLAAKLGGQRLLDEVTGFQHASAITVRQLVHLCNEYTEILHSRGKLAAELIKFKDELPIRHDLVLSVTEMKLRAIAESVAVIDAFFVEQRISNGVKLVNLLSARDVPVYVRTMQAFKDSLKRAKVIENLAKTHAARLIGTSSSSNLLLKSTKRLVGTSAEQAYHMLKQTLEEVNLNIEDIIPDRSLDNVDVDRAHEQMRTVMEDRIDATLSEPERILNAVKQGWMNALKDNPSLTMPEVMKFGIGALTENVTIDSCLKFMLLILRGYHELLRAETNRFEELAKLMYRYRTNFLIHHDVEYFTLYQAHAVYMKKIGVTLRLLSDDLVPGICLQYATVDATQDKLDKFIDDYTPVWDALSAVRKRSSQFYDRICDERTHQWEIAQSTSVALPVPVSYPKAESSKDKPNTSRRRQTKVKTRGAAAAAESSSSSSSDDSSSSSDDDDDDEDDGNDDGDPRLDKKKAIEALRAYYRKQNPTWKAKFVRVAATNEWWAQQMREEERKHEIEEMRQRVANLKTIEDLPSFTTHPPNLPHPRSFAAAQSAAQPSSTSSSSSSSSAVRPNQPMSLDQFWAWQKEDARKRAAELRALKRKQQQQQSKRK
jgi:hypothetical protein